MRPSLLPASLTLIAALASAKLVTVPNSKYPFSHPSSQLLESLSPFPGANFVGHRAQTAGAGIGPGTSPNLDPSAFLAPPKDDCPPCNPFNCVLPSFPCLNNGQSRQERGGEEAAGRWRAGRDERPSGELTRA